MKKEKQSLKGVHVNYATYRPGGRLILFMAKPLILFRTTLKSKHRIGGK